MKMIRNLDIFGQPMRFNIQGQNNVKTLTGATLTLMVLIICVIAIIIMGQDFFQKSNPSIQYSDYVPENSSDPFSLNTTVIQFPFRIYGYNSKFNLNYSGLIEPLAAVLKYEKGNNSLQLKSYEIVPTLPCTNSLLPRTLWSFSNIYNYTCMDFSKVSKASIGGDPDSDYYYIFILFFKCLSKTPSSDFDYAAGICNYDELSEKLAYYQLSLDFTFLDVLYPEFLMTDDYLNPLKPIYRSWSKQFSITTQLISDLLFQTVDFYDDKNWIKTSKEHSSLLSLKGQESTVGFLNKELIVEQQWSFIGISFKMDRVKKIINRRFIKFQELLAQVGGIVNGIQKIFTLIYAVYYQYVQNSVLIQSCFSFIHSEGPERNQSKHSPSIENL
jgi:hypothetical protein